MCWYLALSCWHLAFGISPIRKNYIHTHPNLHPNLYPNFRESFRESFREKFGSPALIYKMLRLKLYMREVSTLLLLLGEGGVLGGGGDPVWGVNF